jgi:hypothetical protein
MSLFCKVEDSNKNLYILTDKNKQPLVALPFINTCIIPNGKKFLNNPELILPTMDEISETNKINKNNDKSVLKSSLFIDTKIQYEKAIRKKDDDNNNIEIIINKSDIDFNIYDIATINKDIVIKNRQDNDRQLTRIEIEQNFIALHPIDKNNDDYYVKMKQKEIELKSKGVDKPPLNIVSEHITELYDYYQKLLNKEEYNNCIISDWTPCNSTNSTRTRTRTQATIIGTACTPDENNLPLTQTCNNCIISDWTPCDDTNLTQTRTRTQALNSTACTPDENNLPLTQSCPSTIKESSDNNIYIGIGIFVLFIFAIAFGFYIFKQKPNQQYPNYQYPNY